MVRKRCPQILAWCCALGAAAPCIAQNLTPAWLELGPSGAIARVIMSAASACPQINLDGALTTLSVRVQNPAAYPVTVCETANPIPAGTKKASIVFSATQSQALPLPVANPQRIVVIGDTGCRIKNTSNITAAMRQRDADLPEAPTDKKSKKEYQACEDPDRWPFAAIAAQAAGEKPDLIIHVGDYLYREAMCPDPAKCDTVFGYNWPTWAADFFTPAAALLPAAPWIFVRGNHEDCGRAWQGYFYFLDPRALSTAACNPDTDAYMVNLGPTAQFGVLDSSNASDTTAPPQDVDKYAAQIKTLSGWMLTHRPVWGLKMSKGNLVTLNATLQKAWEQAKPTNIPLVVTGHVHLFELLSFKQPLALPPQLIVGDSATKLASALPASLDGTPIANRFAAKPSNSLDSFCYGLMTPQGSGWRLRMRSKKGNDKADCQIDLSDNKVSCQNRQ